MAPTIAIAACERATDLDDDWPLLQPALAERGATATAEVWTDPSVDWASFDLVVIRGTWDYFGRLDEFLAWVRRVGATNRLVNPAPLVEWNTDKRYLMDLEADGVPIVSTSWFPPGQHWRAPIGAAEFVIKPTVSAGGVETARYRPEEYDDADRHVQRVHRGGATVMVQPYLVSVDREGETALIYFDGRFSHAVNKGPLLVPGAGVEDRMWERERITATEPSAAHCEVAEAALSASADRTGTGPATYARVDLMAGPDGCPVVSEVELVEPGLFLRYSPGAIAVARFAEVLVSQL
jgi:hypothetical protein